MEDIDLKERRFRDDDEDQRLQGQHPSNPWDAEVDVNLTSDNPVQFQIATCLPLDNSGNILFNNNGRPGFKIKFRLYDNTNNGAGSGYTFPQGANKADAVWSQLGTTCPTTGVWVVFPQNSITVTDNGATAMVTNPNVAPNLGVFRYTLNVLKPGGPYVPLDPGGNNGNGTTQWSANSQ
jgi:hypothetical protein